MFVHVDILQCNTLLSQQMPTRPYIQVHIHVHVHIHILMLIPSSHPTKLLTNKP